MTCSFSQCQRLSLVGGRRVTCCIIPSSRSFIEVNVENNLNETLTNSISLAIFGCDTCFHISKVGILRLFSLPFCGNSSWCLEAPTTITRYFSSFSWLKCYKYPPQEVNLFFYCCNTGWLAIQQHYGAEHIMILLSLKVLTHEKCIVVLAEVSLCVPVENWVRDSCFITLQFFGVRCFLYFC